jgi:hypothetical protein
VINIYIGNKGNTRTITFVSLQFTFTLEKSQSKKNLKN